MDAEETLRFVFELGVKHGARIGLLTERLDALTAENRRLTNEFVEQSERAERLTKRVAELEEKG